VVKSEGAVVDLVTVLLDSLPELETRHRVLKPWVDYDYSKSNASSEELEGTHEKEGGGEDDEVEDEEVTDTTPSESDVAAGLMILLRFLPDMVASTRGA
jgi:hypothetical protein